MCSGRRQGAAWSSSAGLALRQDGGQSVDELIYDEWMAGFARTKPGAEPVAEGCQGPVGPTGGHAAEEWTGVALAPKEVGARRRRFELMLSSDEPTGKVK